MFVDANILTSERILVELLMLKSPQLLQVDIELSDKPKNTIQDYFTILDEFITARECAELNTFQGYSNKRTSERFSNQHGYGPPMGNFHRQQNRENYNPQVLQLKQGVREKRTFKCIFCDSELHLSRNCTTPKIPLGERFSTIVKNKACTLCIIPGHFKQDCQKRGQIVCKTCQSTSHATPLHGTFPTKTVQDSRNSNFPKQHPRRQPSKTPMASQTK